MRERERRFAAEDDVELVAEKAEAREEKDVCDTSCRGESGKRKELAVEDKLDADERLAWLCWPLSVLVVAVVAVASGRGNGDGMHGDDDGDGDDVNGAGDGDDGRDGDWRAGRDWGRLRLWTTGSEAARERWPKKLLRGRGPSRPPTLLSSIRS